MGKRGPKEAPLHVKKIREMFIANLGRLSELFYGMETSRRRTDQDMAKKMSKEEVGSENNDKLAPQSPRSTPTTLPARLLVEKSPFLKSGMTPAGKNKSKLSDEYPNLWST